MNFVENIDKIVASKDGKAAINSRKRYGLEDALIQPTIIVQQCILSDYTFTIFTDSDDRKLKIDISSAKIPDKAMIAYDKEHNEIKIEDLSYYASNYVIKDTGEVVEQKLEKNIIEKNWESLVEPLKIAVKNALKLEKYFGRPQDIEGGIKDGRVYFWQARDIGKKAIKHSF